MKISNFFSIVALIATIVIFHSCKEEETAESLELLLNREAVTAGFNAGIYEVEITTNGEWEALPYHSWCKVSPESGTGNATITISLNENDSKAKRSTSVEVNAKLSGNQKKQLIINVQQLESEPVFEVNLSEKSVDFEEQFIELTVTSNMPAWGIVLPPWCKAADGYPLNYTNQGSSVKETTVSLKVLENGAKKSRQGIIGITAVGASILRITITQDPTDFVYVAANGGPASKTFSGSWTAVSGADWITVPASGSGNITFNVAANADKYPRKGIITLTNGDNVKKVAVAQEPKLTLDRSQTWTDVNGTRHTSIPADKQFWNTGEVLEYNRATKGKGVNVVLFNDAFNKMELAVGGVYEASAKESAELFLSMPVLRDYREYFNIYILMRVWPQSGLYNQYPDGTFRALWDGQEGRFLPQIKAMPQMQGIPGKEVVGYYYANGMAGGFMSQFSNGMTYSSYTFGVEPNYPYWTIHEFMGHAFSLLGDMYLASGDISTWEIYPKSYQSVNPITDDPIGDEWAPNCRLAEWNQEAWDAFIALPNNDRHAGNLDSEYRRPLPAGYREKHPSYAGGDYIWRVDYGNDFMNQHTLGSSGWSRYLVYRRIMRLAGEPYSLIDFFKNDQQYANITDWYTLLGLHGWAHSMDYDPHQASGSPFAPWNDWDE
jgi:hypothetical protein